MDIPDKLLKSIKYHFPNREPAEVFEVLNLYGEEDHENEVQRVQLAVLQLSEGNFEDLLNYIEDAKQDYRDVLFWSEGGA